jgi:hypothetical protein
MLKQFLAIVVLAADSSARTQLRAQDDTCRTGTKVDLDWQKRASQGKDLVTTTNDVTSDEGIALVWGKSADGEDTLSGSIMLPGAGPWHVRFMFIQRTPPGEAAHNKVGD